MTQKFYLHDALSADTGTLPGAVGSDAPPPFLTLNAAVLPEFSSPHADDAIDGAFADNKNMDGSIGSSAFTTPAHNTNVNPDNIWARRFISKPLRAGTYGAGTWSSAGWHSTTAGGSITEEFGVWFWRPSGAGTKVGTVFDITHTSTTFTVGGAWISVDVTGSDVTIQDGDILVHEVWHRHSDTNNVQDAFRYDGATEGTNASYLNAPVNIPLLTDVVITPAAAALVLSGFAPIVTATVSPSATTGGGGVIFPHYPVPVPRRPTVQAPTESPQPVAPPRPLPTPLPAPVLVTARPARLVLNTFPPVVRATQHQFLTVTDVMNLLQAEVITAEEAAAVLAGRERDRNLLVGKGQYETWLG